jgi:hypothetical protein
VSIHINSAICSPIDHFIAESVCGYRSLKTSDYVVKEEPAYGIDTRTERRGQRISYVDVGQALITAMRQAIGCHAILRDPGFITLLNVVEIGHESFLFLFADLLKNFKGRAEPL